MRNVAFAILSSVVFIRGNSRISLSFLIREKMKTKPNKVDKIIKEKLALIQLYKQQISDKRDELENIVEELQDFIEELDEGLYDIEKGCELVESGIEVISRRV